MIPTMLHIDSLIYYQRNTSTLLGNDSVDKQNTKNQANKYRRVMDAAVPWDFNWWGELLKLG
jgi:hypothetical protein